MGKPITVTLALMSTLLLSACGTSNSAKKQVDHHFDSQKTAAEYKHDREAEGINLANFNRINIGDIPMPPMVPRKTKSSNSSGLLPTLARSPSTASPRRRRSIPGRMFLRLSRLPRSKYSFSITKLSGNPIRQLPSASSESLPNQKLTSWVLELHIKLRLMRWAHQTASRLSARDRCQPNTYSMSPIKTGRRTISHLRMIN